MIELASTNPSSTLRGNFFDNQPLYKQEHAHTLPVPRGPLGPSYSIVKNQLQSQLSNKSTKTPNDNVSVRKMPTRNLDPESPEGIAKRVDSTIITLRQGSSLSKDGKNELADL